MLVGCMFNLKDKIMKKKRGYHRHHIIPKHMGGTDDESNLVYLTPEEHAAAHLKLFEEFGHYEDAAAFNSLSKNWIERKTISGYTQSPEHIKKRVDSTDYSKISKKLKGRRSPTTGMKFGPRPENVKKKISDGLRGKKFSDSRKKKISDGMKGNTPANKLEFYCIFCHKRMPPSRADRHGPGKAQCLTKDG